MICEDCIVKKNRQSWLDVLRFLAIIGVLIDHVNGIVYSNQIVAWVSYYSVSLFIIISGYNTFSSWDRKPYGIVKVKKKCIAMVVPYMISVFIFDVIDNHFFSLEDYLFTLVHFNASGPHYYVLLYLQFVIIGPFLASWIANEGIMHRCIHYLIITIVTIVISFFTTNYTDLFGVYGGGDCLKTSF